MSSYVLKSYDKPIEGLDLYHRYVDIINYVFMITEKYPKREKGSLVEYIKKETLDGMNYIINAYRCFDLTEKNNYLQKLDTSLKMQKVLVRVSKQKEYITYKNYEAWSKKIFNLGNLTGGWINSVKNNKK